MMHTAYYLGRILLTRQPEVCINAGIAGAFDGNLQPGDVVQVTEEQMADTGAEAKQDFYDGFELGLFNEDEPPFTDKRLLNNTSTCHALFANLSLKKGLTVNKVHGRGDSIRQVHTKFQADVESMEGAAFFFCCLMNNLPFYEIRAVSNYVEPRNKERWHIRKAIRNLNKELIECLHQFTN